MKKIISIMMAVTWMLLPSFTAFAASSNEISDTAPTITLLATITDDITGEKVSVPAKIITSQVSKELGTEFTEEATAIFSFSQPNIKKQYSDTSITETDVKATVKISYDRSGDKIRVNSVSGGWVPSNSLLRVYNREVDYGDGAPFLSSHSAHQYPTSNSFNYSTGWGWVTYYPASADAMSGARAFTSASVEISGMTPHTIEVFVTATH